MKKYKSIIEHYESCLEKHGDSNLGVDWPNLNDVDKRYRVMLEIIDLTKGLGPKENISLLDFGCGAGHLKDYLNKNNLKFIQYSGLDISPKFIDLCRSKFKGTEFFVADILEEEDTIGNYDYIIMNGVFTEKRDLSFEEMWDYFMEMILKVYNKCNKGIAFNVMSKNVDWERDDLFHLSHDKLSGFLIKNLTRNYVIRNDYGLYEYTTYVYK